MTDYSCQIGHISALSDPPSFRWFLNLPPFLCICDTLLFLDSLYHGLILGLYELFEGFHQSLGFNEPRENYYSGKLLSGDNGIKSDKRSDGHAYGLLNIKAITQKYNGDCSIDTDNNLFRISVIIPMAK